MQPELSGGINAYLFAQRHVSLFVVQYDGTRWFMLMSKFQVDSQNPTRIGGAEIAFLHNGVKMYTAFVANPEKDIIDYVSAGYPEEFDHKKLRIDPASDA